LSAVGRGERLGDRMSQQDVEVVRRSFDVWNTGDVEAIGGLYAEDAVMEGGTGLGGTLEAGDPIGDLVAEVQELWAEVRFEL
jgi:ketosteroid isomerase-like protein